MTSRTSLSPKAIRPRVRRSAAVATVGIAATLSLSACQWTSPLTTQLQYDAADGKSVKIGDVTAQNALIVADKKGAPGALFASLDNRGGTPQTVRIQVGDTPVGSVDVPAHSVVRIGQKSSTSESSGAKTASVTIPEMAAAPGQMTTVTFASASGGATPADLPILLPQGPYASLAPAAAPTSSSPAGSATSAPGTTAPSASSTTAPTTPGATTSTTP